MFKSVVKKVTLEAKDDVLKCGCGCEDTETECDGGCDNCTCDEIDLEEIEVPEGYYLFSEEQVKEISDRMEELENEASEKFVQMDTEGVQDICYNTEDFEKGIDSMTFMAGQITALMNAGLTQENAIGMIANNLQMEHEMKVAIVQSNMNIKIAEIGALKAEQSGM